MKKTSLRELTEYIRLGIFRLNQMKSPQLAANTGYFIVLSVFPALLLVLSGLSYTGLTVEKLLEMLEVVLHQSLMGTARQLILSVYKNASGAVAGVSALTALCLTCAADVDTLAQCQYLLTKPLCLVCDDAAVLEAALRVYQGRALYDGALPEDTLLPLCAKYGLLL